jgi:hypothetical protein
MMKRQLLGVSALVGLASACLAQTPATYQNDFEKAEIGKLPEEFMVLNGTFTVRAEGGNKFLELPGDPVDDFSLLFGPTESAGLMASVRIYGTAKGRRLPAFALGLNGVGGYELQISPGRRAVELMKGEERLASVPYPWVSGTWTVLKLQVRKLTDGAWKIEGKAWKEGTPEPAKWMVSHEDKTEPPAGRALISGHPISGTAILFDDLKVVPAAGQP